MGGFHLNGPHWMLDHVPNHGKMEMMKYICHLSGGITSWAAAKRVAIAHGPESVVLVFADTLIEDQDNYRFLIEGAANIEGVPTPLCAYWDLPEPHENLPKRKQLLAEMRGEATRLIPGLHWLADGRTPWEVFESERFIGNSRIDPCSKFLKRMLLDKWRKANFSPDSIKIAVGILWDEVDRIIRLRSRQGEWDFIAPLVSMEEYDSGFGHCISKIVCMQWAAKEGLEPARMYGMNFAHANCGGFCVKAGLGHFANYRQQFPERFAHDMAEEKRLMALLGSKWGILRDRRGGTAKPLTLEEFDRRCAAKELTELEQLDIGGCACAIE